MIIPGGPVKINFVIFFQAAAIVENKLKMTDVHCAVEVCSLMHRRYIEFSTVLREQWQKVLPKKDEKVSNFLGITCILMY